MQWRRRIAANIGPDSSWCHHTRTLTHTNTHTNDTQTGKQAAIDGWTHLLILAAIAGTGHDSKGRLSRPTIRTFGKFLHLHPMDTTNSGVLVV